MLTVLLKSKDRKRTGNRVKLRPKVHDDQLSSDSCLVLCSILVLYVTPHEDVALEENGKN